MNLAEHSRGQYSLELTLNITDTPATPRMQQGRQASMTQARSEQSSRRTTESDDGLTDT
jgi:hypothetical protein